MGSGERAGKRASFNGIAEGNGGGLVFEKITFLCRGSRVGCNLLGFRRRHACRYS